ncbi:uncharacterized protein METZ01_LOCUS243033, partial [marine metagenome]
MSKLKILVTGMCGRLGTVIGEKLNQDFELTSLDLTSKKGFKSYTASIACLEAIQPAFLSQDVVIHLGADPRGEAPWTSILENNIIGTRNVFEAARIAGVKRVIFATTNHVVGYLYQQNNLYKSIFEGTLKDFNVKIPQIPNNSSNPDCLYAVSKLFGESLASYYHDKFKMSFICIRFGGIEVPDRKVNDHPSKRAVWLSHTDLAQIIKLSINAPSSVGYEIIYGISNNTLKVHDLTSAKSSIGYHPVDDAG